MNAAKGAAMPAPPTAGEVARTSMLLTRLLRVARRRLGDAYLADTGEFCWSLRRLSPSRATVRVVGRSVRYSAIALLGISRLPVDEQRLILNGGTARQCVAALAHRLDVDCDPAELALAAWAAAETGADMPDHLADRVAAEVDAPCVSSTVTAAWLLLASLAMEARGLRAAPGRARASLLAARVPESGLFSPTVSGRGLRSHVGSFADQIYPIQALARYARAHGSMEALELAETCAARVAVLQGDMGQWWWHYDSRTGTVIERYPVYSVHQYGMAPMALSELHAAGGGDYANAIRLGLNWLSHHPEMSQRLIDWNDSIVWRKVGRREFPRKTVRATHALTTRVSPRLRLGAIDYLAPPRVIDHECRPYELGWLLYAWAGSSEAQPTRMS